MATPKTARAGTRRRAGQIRRERHSVQSSRIAVNAIAAELENLQKENAGLRAALADIRGQVAPLDTADQIMDRDGWAALSDPNAVPGYVKQVLEKVISQNEYQRALLWEFLSTHCAPLELRARATAAVGKPPLEFGRKETKP